MSEPHPNSTSNLPGSPPTAAGAPCPHCAAQQGMAQTQYIYSIGKIEVLFPSAGIEREFQQRERLLLSKRPAGWAHAGERFEQVLSANPHLARAVCFVHLIGGIPAYIVVPTGAEVLSSLVAAVHASGSQDRWSILIGKRGPMATPTTCNGLLAPMVACDQVYTFTFEEFAQDLTARAEPFLKARKLDQDEFRTVADDIFRRITRSLENLGAQDGHRALNYLLVQHPGIFLAAAERAKRAVLDNIETRMSKHDIGNRVATIILTFIDQATGVPERLFCRVDVTEEWPYLADVAHGGATPLGLSPYIESSGAASFAY